MSLQEASRHKERDVLRDQTFFMSMCISGEHLSMHFCDAIQVRGLLCGDLFNKSSYMCYVYNTTLSNFHTLET